MTTLEKQTEPEIGKDPFADAMEIKDAYDTIIEASHLLPRLNSSGSDLTIKDLRLIRVRGAMEKLERYKRYYERRPDFMVCYELAKRTSEELINPNSSQ